jgi:hypothetical protein
MYQLYQNNRNCQTYTAGGGGGTPAPAPDDQFYIFDE